MLEYLIILKTDDENEYYTYYIIRCQKRAIKQRLEDNPNYSEIKRIECVPNLLLENKCFIYFLATY
jgi:hypothetical protein